MVGRINETRLIGQGVGKGVVTPDVYEVTEKLGEKRIVEVYSIQKLMENYK